MANHELPLAGVRVLELADHRTALGGACSPTSAPTCC